MDITQTKIIGLDELKARFALLPTDISKKVLRKMGSAGARVIKTAVIAGTPVAAQPHRRGVSPGLLRRAAIIKFVREQSSVDQATYIVTYRQGKKAQSIGKRQVNLDAFYARWVERGHKIVPRSKRVGTRGGKARYAESKRARQQKAAGRVAGLFFFAAALRVSQAKALTAMVDTGSSEIRRLDGIT